MYQLTVISIVAVQLLQLISNVAASTDRLRPMYHVMPKQNWCNDPNGPMYFNGVYHLFYQYNPNEPLWGNIHWGHVVSRDLAHWAHLPPALSPDKPYDSAGVYSGSATIVNGKPVIYYTCVAPGNIQRQCLAYPSNLSDPFLTEWTKDSANPVIDQAPPGGTTTQFRDPTTAFKTDTNKWAILTGASIEGQAATAMYTSDDFQHWEYSGEFINDTNRYGSPVDMWECPDIYNISLTQSSQSDSLSNTRREDSVMSVFKWSEQIDDQDQDWAFIGKMDASSHQFMPLSPQTLYDYGTWYASKTFYDPISQKRILWGWIRETHPIVLRNWAGMQSIPRVVDINQELGIVTALPASNIERLRIGSPKIMQNLILKANETKLIFPNAGDQYDLSVTFALPVLHSSQTAEPVAFGLLVRANNSENIGTKIIISYTNGSIEYEQNQHRPGGEYRGIVYDANEDIQSNIANCSATCEQEAACLAWSYIEAGHMTTDDPEALSRCSLKWYIPQAKTCSFCTSGIVPSTMMTVVPNYGNGGLKTRGRIPMTKDESSITLRVLIDHSVMEIFAHKEGRARAAVRMYPFKDANSIGIFSVNPTEPYTYCDIYNTYYENLKRVYQINGWKLDVPPGCLTASPEVISESPPIKIPLMRLHQMKSIWVSDPNDLPSL